MLTDRRSFLRAFGLGAAAAIIAPEVVLDPERALWVPGRKTIFLPSPPVVPHLAFHPAAFSLVCEDLVRDEALQMLANNLSFAGRVNRLYSQESDLKPGDHFTLSFGWKQGSTLRVRKPERFLVKSVVTSSR